MRKPISCLFAAIAAAGFIVGVGTFSKAVSGPGAAQPQPIDTAGLPPLGDEWRMENPYRGNDVAIRIGEHGYTQNCARCHGIDGISGGLAPDLRLMDPGVDGDEWYILRTRDGYAQNGVTKMPAYHGILNQEAMWAIRSWIDTKQQ